MRKGLKRPTSALIEDRLLEKIVWNQKGPFVSVCVCEGSGELIRMKKLKFMVILRM